LPNLTQPNIGATFSDYLQSELGEWTFGEMVSGEMSTLDISPKGRSVNGFFGEDVLYDFSNRLLDISTD